MLNVTCIDFGIEINTDIPWTVEVDLYLGDIDGPFDALDHIANTAITIPAWTSKDFFTAVPIFRCPQVSMHACLSLVA